MPIRFVCPACQARISVADSFAGHRGTCPRCRNPVQVPSTLAEAPPPAPPNKSPDSGAIADEWSFDDLRDDKVRQRRDHRAQEDEGSWRSRRSRRRPPPSLGQVWGRVGGGILLVCVLLALFLRISNLAKRMERNRPPEPIKELPSMNGRWEDGRGYIVFAPADRPIDGHHAFHSFERSDGGPPEKGLAVPWNSSLDLPWQKGEDLLYVLENGAIRRREKMRWQFNATTLKIWNEQGQERVYHRKS